MQKNNDNEKNTIINQYTNYAMVWAPSSKIPCADAEFFLYSHPNKRNKCWALNHISP